VDSEPIHLAGFQAVLRPLGVSLTRRDYYGRYLGLDDHDCFAEVLRAAGVAVSEEKLAALVAAKTRRVQQAFGGSIRALPGAAALIRAAAADGLRVGVCSGALREELRLAARAVGVLDCFQAIVAAEDVRRGKPDPEGYALALRRLSAAAGGPLAPARSVVVEDAPAGIDAARAAGMHVLAVATSYPADALARADRVAASLADVTLDDLRALL
jgi:HAD superfamily hydrolase (TIGR01509 family)